MPDTMTTAKTIERAADLIEERGYNAFGYGDEQYTGPMCEVGALKHAIAGSRFDYISRHLLELEAAAKALHPDLPLRGLARPSVQAKLWGGSKEGDWPAPADFVGAQQKLVRHMRETAARLSDPPSISRLSRVRRVMHRDKTLA